MLRALFLAAAMQGLAALHLHAQDAGGPASSALDAASILGRMSAAYASCTAYRDAGVIEHCFSDPRPDADAIAQRATRELIPFMTAFGRPGRFRFECKGSAEGPRAPALVGQTGSDVRVWLGRTGETTEVGTLDMALKMTRTDSCDASLDIAKLLVPLQISAPALAADLVQAERIADADLEDIPCFRVHGKYQDSMGRGTDCTIWIDQRSFLIRRTEKVSAFLGPRETTTATYEPEIDIEISTAELGFDPPKEGKLRPRDLEIAKIRASNPPTLSEALTLSMVGKHEEAMVELDRLWTAEDTPNWEDQPLTFKEEQLIPAIGREASKHRPTHEHFEKIFEALDAEVRAGGAGMHAWTRWAALARALKLDDRVLQLYMERRSPEGTLRPYDDMNPLAIDVLEDILVERKQFHDAGRLLADPVAQTEWAYKSISLTAAQALDAKRAPQITREMTGSYRSRMTRLHALTLAAGRIDEAAEIAAVILGNDDTVEARRQLILAGLECAARSGSTSGWLEEIRERGGDVSDLEAKLKLAAAPAN
jgi:hypothetical protein